MGNFDTLVSIGSTFTALVDLSAYQFRVMKQDSAGVVTIPSVKGEGGVGLLQNKPDTAGHAAAIGISGVSLAITGGAFSGGDPLTNDTTGRLVLAGTDDEVIAEAVEDSSKANLVVAVLIKQTGKGAEPLTLTDSGAGVTEKTFIKLNGSGEGLTATDGDIAIGVAAGTAVAAADITVQTSGEVLVTAGETIDEGDLIAPFSTTGRAKVATDSDHAAGIALSGNTVGLEVQVLLIPISRNPSLTLTDSGAGVTLKTFVKLNTTGEMLTATEGDQALGVVTETVGAAADGHVQTRGVALVTAGETIVAGDPIAPFSTTGRAGKADTMGVIMGIALTSNTVGLDVQVALLPLGVPDFIILNTAADYSAAGAGKLVDIDASGEAVIVATLGAKYVGAIVSASATEALIRVTRVVKVLSGEAFTAGDKLCSDAVSKAITAYSGEYVGAIALEDASGADELKKALLTGHMPAAGAWHVLGLNGDGGLVGSSTIIEDMEFPVAMTTRRVYATVSVAPGAGKVVTITIGSKTCLISDTAVKGENEALDEAIAADTDFDVSVVDDGVAEDLQIVLWVQETNPA